MPKIEHTASGREIVDNRPVEMPLGFKKPEPLSEQIQRMVRRELSRAAEQSGFESFDEANDFEVEDDLPDPGTPYEMEFDPVLGREVSPDMIKRDEENFRREYINKAKKDPAFDDAIERAERRSFFKNWLPSKRASDRDGPSQKDRPSRSERTPSDGFGQETPLNKEPKTT